MKITIDLSLIGESFVDFTKDYALLNDQAESSLNTADALDSLKCALQVEAMKILRSYRETATTLREARAKGR
jgi:hypothetical protein